MNQSLEQFHNDYSDVSEVVSRLHEVMKADGIFLCPTDTIWGIACDALSPTAVSRIRKLKNRSKDQGFIILVESIGMLKEYVESIHPRFETLLQYHKRPLTVVYDTPKNLPKFLISHEGTIAIRVAQDDFCRGLIRSYENPIISTSANFHGRPYPHSFEEIDRDIFRLMDFVVPPHFCKTSGAEPSLLVKVDSKGQFEVLRP